MTDLEHKSRWWAAMIVKHGSEEAVRDFMRQSANDSRRNKAGKGGFAAMKRTDPERLIELAKKGGSKSRVNKVPPTLRET